MCGRYYLENTIEMEPFLEKMKRSSLVRRWNDTSAVITAGEIHPTDVVPVIATNQAGKQSVFPMRWGYNGKTLLINAKVETAKEKPTFRDVWIKPDSNPESLLEYALSASSVKRFLSIFSSSAIQSRPFL